MHFSMRDLELGIPKTFMKNLTPIERYIIFSAQGQKHPLCEFLQWKEQASQTYANYCIMQIARKVSHKEDMEVFALASAYGHSRNALALTLAKQTDPNASIDLFKPKEGFYPTSLKTEISTSRQLLELWPYLSRHAKRFYPQGLPAPEEFNIPYGALTLNMWLLLFQHPLDSLPSWLSSQEATLRSIQSSENTLIQIALTRHFVAKTLAELASPLSCPPSQSSTRCAPSIP